MRVWFCWLFYLSTFVCFFLAFFCVYLKIFYCMPDIDGRKIETEVNIIYIQKRMCLFYRPSEWVVESVYLGIELGCDFVSAIISFSTPQTSYCSSNEMLLSCAKCGDWSVWGVVLVFLFHTQLSVVTVWSISPDTQRLCCLLHGALDADWGWAIPHFAGLASGLGRGCVPEF